MRYLFKVSASLISLRSGTPEEQSVIDHLMTNLNDPASNLRNTSILIESKITSKKAEPWIRRDNLAFKPFCDVESKQLFTYEYAAQKSPKRDNQTARELYPHSRNCKLT
jgi:hypothetical protein